MSQPLPAGDVKPIRTPGITFPFTIVAGNDPNGYIYITTFDNLVTNPDPTNPPILPACVSIIPASCGEYHIGSCDMKQDALVCNLSNTTITFKVP